MEDDPLPHFLGRRPTQHLGQGLGCSDLLTEGGDSALFRVPSSVNGRLWAVGDDEWYLHLKQGSVGAGGICTV